MNAEVLVKFNGDTKDLDKETSKAQSSLKGFASGVSSAFKVATGVIAATTTAVGVLIKKSVEGYAEFEQLEGGLESLFGKGSAEMQKILEKSEQAYMDLTMSQNEYLTAFESSYSLVKNGLADQSKAIEYTNDVLQLSSDLFNTYGKSTEYYQNAIEWALKGTFSYLDNLQIGILGTEEGFVEAANSAGILNREIKSVKELTNEEIIEVIKQYAKEAGAWGRTQEEASKTIVGSLKMTKAAWSNLITGLSKDGADVDKLIDNLINSALKFGENIMPVIMRAIEGIGKALPKIADYIGKELPGLVDKLLPPLMKTLSSLIKSIASALPDLIKTLAPLLVETLISIIEGIAQNLPEIIQALIQGVITIIQAIAKALPTLMPTIVQAYLDGILALLDNIDVLIECGIQLTIGLIKGMIAAIPVIIERLPEIIMKIAEGLVNGFITIVGVGADLIKKLWEGIKTLKGWIVEKIKGIGKSILNGLINSLANIVNVGTNLVKGLWEGIKNVTSWIVNKIKGFGKSVMNAIKGIFGVHSPSTEFEWVGKMNILGLEKGMEELQPQLQRTINGMFDLQPNVSGSMQSTYSPQMNIQVVNNLETDPLGQLVNNVKTFSGGAKNDYNWGAGI